VRIGIHTGTPHLTDEGYVGPDVHRAARIAAAAHGGQVLVSGATAALLEGHLRDMGEHRLKDLSAPERIYQIGDAEFPRLKTLFRTNAPVPATPFVGRQRELSDVRDLLLREDVRLLTLTGAGGTGKTRLALQAAADAAERYPDGVWWIPLATVRDPQLITSAIAQTLDVMEEPGTALSNALARSLEGRQTLLVVDNVEHLLPAAGRALSELAAVRGVQLLVTSRQRLDVAGEQLYPVPTLDRRDAVALFLARARASAGVFGKRVDHGALCAARLSASCAGARSGAHCRLYDRPAARETRGAPRSVEGRADRRSPAADAARDDRVVACAARPRRAAALSFAVDLRWWLHLRGR
jgi:hypothetical protein